LTTNGICKAGDVLVDSIVIKASTGVTVDITNNILSFEITENLFESWTTGCLNILECSAITNVLPMVGVEFVYVTFQTPAMNECIFNKGFYIYACSDRIQLSDKTAFYQLRIISGEGLTDFQTRVSKTFRGRPHEIMTDIMDSHLLSDKSLFMDEASNDLVFISNWWHPKQCIDYLCRHSIGVLSGSPSYLFFESLKGFWFVTLDTLVQSDSYQKFVVGQYGTQVADSVNTTAEYDINAQFQNILEIEYNNGFDYFERSVNGYYGLEIIGFDINTQQYIHTRSGANFDDFKHLNKYTCTGNTTIGYTSTRIEYVPYETQNFENQTRGIDDTNIPSRGARQQLLSWLKTTGCTIKVFGRCDYDVGMIVTLVVPKNEDTRKGDDTTDNLLSGNYLVTSLKHIVTKSSHYCILQLMKDSYIFDINNSANDETTKSLL